MFQHHNQDPFLRTKISAKNYLANFDWLFIFIQSEHLKLGRVNSR